MDKDRENPRTDLHLDSRIGITDRCPIHCCPVGKVDIPDYDFGGTLVADLRPTPWT